MYSVVVSRTFQKQFHSLQNTLQERIKTALKELETNPIQSRSGAYIKPLKNTNPLKYKLRVGEYRIIYVVKDDAVHVIDVFKRGKGYHEI